MNKYTIQNIVEGGAFGISITGMSIVFAGLILITLYITLLPRILGLLEKKPEVKPELTVEETPEEKETDEETEEVREAWEAQASREAQAAEDESRDIASVIGLVLQLEYERLHAADIKERLTISRNFDQPSLWGRAGKMRELPQRRIREKI